MAALNPCKRFWDEKATCPLCQRFFTEPVMQDCGHNFCSFCINKFWRESNRCICPLCEQIIQPWTMRENTELVSLVVLAQELSARAKEEAEARGVCEMHQEPLALFCKDHEALVCVLCHRSMEHQPHRVVPVEEAAPGYKDQICTSLERMRKRREEITTFKANTEKEHKGLLKQTAAQKQKMEAEFRQLHQLLVEEEKNQMVKIEEVEKEIARKMDEVMTSVTRMLSLLEKPIQEMEKKCQQSASELMQSVSNTLQRGQKAISIVRRFFCVTPFPCALKGRIRDLCDINPFLKQIRDNLVSEFQPQKANVTLDLDTAHPRLILAEDRKSVRWGEKWQDLPDNPERFRNQLCVLGCEGFTTGSHYWEVSVGRKVLLAVGVVRKSVERVKCFNYGPGGGIWGVKKTEDEYWALTAPLVPLRLSWEPKRIRVTLHCDGRKVAFSDADSGAPIYTFSEASFSGETLFPFFWVDGKSVVKLSP